MKFINIFLLAVFLLVSVPYAEASTSEADLHLQLLAIAEYVEQLLPSETAALGADEMRQIITDGADWLVASQETSGRFGYEYLPYEGEYADDDNIVRQAGSLYALGEVYRAKTNSDPELAAAIEASSEYFANLTKSIDEGGSCIRSSYQSYDCRTGTTALALLGILSYVEGEPDKRVEYDELITEYADFLLRARLTDGGFSENYNFGSGFKQKESPFFNGEILLALVHYYQYEPSAEVKQAIEEVFAYLAEKEYESPLYLWIMAALKDMQALWPNEAYVQYASDFTLVRLDVANRYHGTVHNYCAPLEGLTSAYSVLVGSESPEYLDRLDTEIEYWLRVTASLQLDVARPYRVVMVDDQLQLVKLPKGSTLAHGGFLTGRNELTQRIDFTQHCVSAYLQKLEDIDQEQL